METFSQVKYPNESTHKLYNSKHELQRVLYTNIMYRSGTSPAFNISRLTNIMFTCLQNCKSNGYTSLHTEF